jgi:hypothetical protein
VFPQIANAYDLPMCEFLDRIEQANELAAAARDGDPLSIQMRVMEKRMRKISKLRRDT